VLDTNNKEQLIAFLEKPVHHYEVSTGIYMINKQVIHHIPKDRSFEFDNLMHTLLTTKKEINVQQYDGYRLDI